MSQEVFHSELLLATAEGLDLGQTDFLRVWLFKKASQVISKDLSLEMDVPKCILVLKIIPSK
jgi:hypothetical protein